MKLIPLIHKSFLLKFVEKKVPKSVRLELLSDVPIDLGVRSVLGEVPMGHDGQVRIADEQNRLAVISEDVVHPVGHVLYRPVLS